MTFWASSSKGNARGGFFLSLFAVFAAAALFGGEARSQGGPPTPLPAPKPAPLTDPMAIERVRQSCDAGNLADCYLYGRSIRPKGYDVKAMKPSFDVSEKACDKGYAPACNDKARRYVLGINVKVDLKKGRKAAVQGCDGGDSESCELVKRLDNPPPSAAALRNFPAAEQMNVNHALYFDNIGAERLDDYADKEPYASKPEWHWNLQAASCELGYIPACTRAALGFMDGPGYVNPYKKDMSRAVDLLRIGCAADDGIACYTLGNALVMQNGSMGSEATAAYVKSRPHMQKACGDGIKKGYGCSFLGYMGEFSIGVEYRPDEVEANYSRGCELGSASSCTGLAKFREKRAKQDAPRLEREKWANGAQSKAYCDGLVNEWNAAASRTQADYAAIDARRAKTTDAYNANRLFAEMTNVKQDGCYVLLEITRKGQFTCRAQYEDMLHSSMKIHDNAYYSCPEQLREMDKDYHNNFR